MDITKAQSHALFNDKIIVLMVLKVVNYLTNLNNFFDYTGEMVGNMLDMDDVYF